MEMFDVYDENWQPAGIASREDTHRLGLRHRAFHCWLINRSSGQPNVRFQKRQIGKDTYPGYLDITAAGHLTAGEKVYDAIREIEEELGVSVIFDELIPLGWHEKRATGIAGDKPFIDHERSEVFALHCELPLLEHRLQRDEVAGIYEAPLKDMIQLFEGKVDLVEARGAEWGDDKASGNIAGTATGLVPVRIKIQAKDFIPREQNYYAELFRQLLELA
ncbi:NUDIX domain-containing protein [Paenibacillaceae bacterium GAS479]|nr:NUDIX domain-containing protein [Paenibacillaceae bacterium GAS479]